MYASVRVHQLKDYCPRDDLWSLLYVFCDLVSGGLPWMAHAASRDRESCQILKERIHGEKEGHSDQTSRLLMGDDYHRGLYKKYKGNVDSILDSELEDDAQDVPEPLPLYKDEKKVELLRKAFRHLGTLNFWDTPDYDLIKQCLEGFLEGEDTSSNDASTIPINWELLAESAEKSKKTKTTTEHILFKDVPTWDFVDDAARDPIDSSMFYDAEKRQSEKAAAGEVAAEEATKLTGEAADMARLPLEMKFRIAQMEYNTSHHSSIPLHLALRDWLKVALPILYGEWDSRRFEKGGHRSNEDGYRRETYLRIVEKCLKCADRFNGFRGIDSICSQGNGENGSIVKNEEAGFVEKEVKIEIEQETAPKRKRRKILSTLREPSSGSLGSDLIAISQVSFQLRAAKKAEEKKSFAPPPRLLFGSSSAR